MPSPSTSVSSNHSSNFDCNIPATSLNRAPDTHPIIQRRHGVDDFPDEILYEIFLEVVMDDFNNAAMRFDGSERCAPWNFAAVCGNWRRVCLANARLWTYYVVVDWHYCTSDDFQGYDGLSIVRIRLQLKRSRELPLHANASFDCECRCALSVLRALGKECHRWKSLEYNGDAFIQVEFQDILPTNPRCSQIESLTWVRGSVVDEFICPLIELTKLRSVKLIYHGYGSEDPLPWSQLTHLDLALFTGDFDTLLTVVSKCPALANLQISVCMLYYPEEEEQVVRRYELDSVIVLPNLSSLDFTNGHFAPAVLLPYLRLPVLRKLVYMSTHTPSATVANLVDRSSCPLTEVELHLGSTQDSALELSPLREKLTQLESLAIRDVRDSKVGIRNGNKKLHCDEALRSLAVDGESSVIFPRLKHLELHDIDFDPVLLAHMVDSRQDANDVSTSPLQSVTVSIYGFENPGLGFYKRVLDEFLEERIQHGLEVYYHDTDCRA